MISTLAMLWIASIAVATSSAFSLNGGRCLVHTCTATKARCDGISFPDPTQGDTEDGDGVLTWTDLCPLSALPTPGSTTILRVPLKSHGGDDEDSRVAVAVAVDSLGKAHTLLDVVPCVGHRLSSLGVADGQVRAVFDGATGRKYRVDTGEVRATKVRHRGFTWPTHASGGLPGLALRTVLKPRRTEPLRVVACRSVGSTLQVSLPHQQRQDDHHQLHPNKKTVVGLVLFARALRQAAARSVDRRAGRSFLAAPSTPNTTTPTPESSDDSRSSKGQQSNEGGSVSRRQQFRPRPWQRWPANSTVFSVTYKRLRSSPAWLRLPRQLLGRRRKMTPRGESMGIIVGRRDGVELGRAQFKVVFDDGHAVDEAGAAGSSAMSTLLDDVFGAFTVKEHCTAAAAAAAVRGRDTDTEMQEKEGGEGTGGSANSGKRVGVVVSVFVEPEARRLKIGAGICFAMLRELRANGHDFALLVHQDNGSGKLIAWYQGMGFKLLPPDNAIGVQDGMIAMLPRDINDDFYMNPIRETPCDIYDGVVIDKHHP